MNGCTLCEKSFSYSSPLTIYLVESNSGEILVYAQNNGRNIVVIKRLLLCRESSTGGLTINYLREADFISGGEMIEGGTVLKYRASGAGVVSARAYAEYIEITGRSLSCKLSLS